MFAQPPTRSAVDADGVVEKPSGPRWMTLLYRARVHAVPQLDLARIRQYCGGRVPAHLRDEVRVEADVRGKSVTIFECRPPSQPTLTDWFRVPVAQLRYNSDGHLWTLYWADRNSRWHRYDDIEPGTSDELLNEIDEDPMCVFWG